MRTAAIEIHQLSHSYGSRKALSELTLDIYRGEVFVFLGPNGGGKTTLFRILSTLTTPQSGEVRLLGMDLPAHTRRIRESIGVVFQSPSLDKKLTVAENLHCQAALYGVTGDSSRRCRELLEQFGLLERSRERVETLSGGLRRRVELAKAMIHQPPLLLMDEPSTGLDPGARSDLWRYLLQLRDEREVTIALTSHLLDEADRADRIAILHHGSLVALDTPEALRSSVGGDLLMIETDEPAALARDIAQHFQCRTSIVEGHVRLEQQDGHRWVSRLVEAFPKRIQSVKLGKPTLEDVFIGKTGHRFWSDEPEQPGIAK